MEDAPDVGSEGLTSMPPGAFATIFNLDATESCLSDTPSYTLLLET